MNREEWMARCAMAYDLGLVTEERLNLMARWLDLVMEEGHSRMSDRHDLGSEEARRARWESIHAFWYGSGGELERLERNSARMYRPSTGKSQGNPLATKANDVEGSEIIQLAALFAHPCQRCATNPHAWWARPESCSHSLPQETEPVSVEHQSRPTPRTTRPPFWRGRLAHRMR